jgi:hypothetical protein
MEVTVMMSDRTFSELVNSCEAMLDAAGRSMAIARSLAEGFRAGLRPPEDVLEAYLARIERDQEQLNELRQRMADLKVR